MGCVDMEYKPDKVDRILVRMAWVIVVLGLAAAFVLAVIVRFANPDQAIRSGPLIIRGLIALSVLAILIRYFRLGKK